MPQSRAELLKVALRSKDDGALIDLIKIVSTTAFKSGNPAMGRQLYVFGVAMLIAPRFATAAAVLVLAFTFSHPFAAGRSPNPEESLPPPIAARDQERAPRCTCAQ